MWLHGRGIFDHRGQINKLGRGLLNEVHTNYQGSIGLVVSAKNKLKVFIPRTYFNSFYQVKQKTGTIWSINKEDHIKFTPAKFGRNPASSIGGGVLWIN